MNPTLTKILAAAIGVSLLLAMAMGGMFAYLFFALALVLVVVIVVCLAASPSASERTTLPSREPVFEESRHFSELDAFSQNEQRKKLAQQLERRIQKGDHKLTA